jgi:SAM-dependent methyltransferase
MPVNPARVMIENVAASSESYTPGYTPNAIDFMRRRTAESHAAFFLPYLEPGMRLLDCGCGPGTITSGLAARVAPGETVPVDLEVSQCPPDLRPRAADVYALPFPDSCFDAVFSHALFEHLREPVRALFELNRVLRPGGVIGLRAPDWGGFLLHPRPAPFAAAIRYYAELQNANGGDVETGRKLGAYLRASGFVDVQSTATYEIYPDPVMIAEFMALRLDPTAPEQATALRDWSKDPDALFAQAWGEAVARKPRA